MNACANELNGGKFRDQISPVKESNKQVNKVQTKAQVKERNKIVDKEVELREQGKTYLSKLQLSSTFAPGTSRLDHADCYQICLYE